MRAYSVSNSTPSMESASHGSWRSGETQRFLALTKEQGELRVGK